MIAILLFAFAAFVLGYAIAGILGWVLGLGLPLAVLGLTILSEGFGRLDAFNTILVLVLCAVGVALGQMVRHRQDRRGRVLTA